MTGAGNRSGSHDEATPIRSLDRSLVVGDPSAGAWIELIDPHDLLDGLARCRSSYGSRLFTSGDTPQYRFQKIGGRGAMHLSAILPPKPNVKPSSAGLVTEGTFACKFPQAAVRLDSASIARLPKKGILIRLS
jgi:hypothetical protein